MKNFFLCILAFIFLERAALAQSCFLGQDLAPNGTGELTAGDTYLVIDGNGLTGCQPVDASCDFATDNSGTLTGVGSFSGEGYGTCEIHNSEGTPSLNGGGCTVYTQYPFGFTLDTNGTKFPISSALTELVSQLSAKNSANWGLFTPDVYQETFSHWKKCTISRRFTAPLGYLKDADKKNTCASQKLGSPQIGSIIDCRDQTFFEKIPVTATPFNLVYSSESNRQSLFPTRSLTYILPYWTNPLENGNKWKLSQGRITVNVAGQTMSQTIPAASWSSDFEATFTWDGKDGSGNPVTGPVVAKAIGSYDFVEGDTPAPGELRHTTETVLMGTYSDPGRVRGWALDAIHRYDLATKTVVLGNGMTIPNVGLTNYMLDANSHYNIPSLDGSELYQFDSSGKHLKTSDFLTGVTTYTIQYTSGYPSSITDRDGLVTTIHRDLSNRISQIDNPYGASTYITYDGSSNITSITDPVGGVQSFTYHTGTLAGLMASMTDAMGKTKYYNYDAEGNLANEQDAKGGTKYLALTTPDTSQRVVTFTSPEGVDTQYKTTNNTDGTVSLENVDASGYTSYQTVAAGESGRDTADSNGRSSSYKFEQHPIFPGRQVTASFSDEVLTTESFTRDFNMGYGGDPLAVASYTMTDFLNGRTYTTTYDRATKTQVDTTPLGRQTTTVMDSKGRPTSVTYPGIAPITYAYNSNGQMTSATQGSRVNHFTYDSAGHLATSQNALSQTTSYGYDANGQLTSVTLPNTKTYGFAYNLNGDLTSLTNAASQTYSYTYDNNREVDLNTEPTIAAASYVWDHDFNGDNQITQITQPDSSLLNYTYDSNGLLASVSGTNLSRTYSYTSGFLDTITSPSGQTLSFQRASMPSQTTWAGNVNGTVGYGWTSSRLLLYMIINGSSSFSYTYDDDLALSSVEDLYLTHDATTGQLTGTTQGTVATTNTYDSFGDSDVVSVTKGGAALISFDYNRDALGRISSIAKTVGGTTTTTSFTYDTVGQLSTETTGATTKTYTYSDNGNRFTTGGSEVYDDQDRLTSNATWNFTYSKKGFLTRKDHKTNGSWVTYQYDDFGNLLKVEYSGGNKVEYQVDGLDRRIRRKLNNAFSAAFLYQDDLKPVAQLNSNGSIKSIFVYGSKPNVPDFMIQGSNKYRIISDHLGSPLYVIKTSNGQIVQQITYDTWGNVLSDSSPGFQPFGFAGGLYDFTTGLVRFGTRDYDPSLGRWLNKDPIREYGGMNYYLYVHNDPINLFDSSGLAPSGGIGGVLSTGDNCTIAGGITGATVGAAIGSIGGRIGKTIGGYIGGKIGTIVGGKWSKDSGGCAGSGTIGPEPFPKYVPPPFDPNGKCFIDAQPNFFGSPIPRYPGPVIKQGTSSN